MKNSLLYLSLIVVSLTSLGAQTPTQAASPQPLQIVTTPIQSVTTPDSSSQSTLAAPAAAPVDPSAASQTPPAAPQVVPSSGGGSQGSPADQQAVPSSGQSGGSGGGGSQGSPDVQSGFDTAGVTPPSNFVALINTFRGIAVIILLIAVVGAGIAAAMGNQKVAIQVGLGALMLFGAFWSYTWNMCAEHAHMSVHSGHTHGACVWSI